MKKRIWIGLLVVALLVGAVVVFTHRENTQTFTVGICQFAKHDSLDEAAQGFQAALTDRLGDQVAFEVQNANGDFSVCTSIINDLLSKDVDLLLANSTIALSAASTATADIPILGIAVTDYGTALQMDGAGDTLGGNISGTSDLVPVDAQAEMIRELFPDGGKIGMVYCSSEPNSQYQVDAAQAALEAMGYTCVPYAFVDAGTLSDVTAEAAEQCDVLYIPTDNTVAVNAELIANICVPQQVPVITGDESTCRICGVATLSVDYYDLGYATGEMAAEILADGKDISEMPVQYASSFHKKYNGELCRQLGVQVPEGYVALD